MSNTETELKYLLSRKDFHCLYHHLQPNNNISLIRQVNYYFASPDSPLTRSPINIRIRFLGEKSELTCKIPIVNQTTDVLQNSYEYNRQFSRKEALHTIKDGLSAKAQTEFFPEMLRNHSLQPTDLICYGHLRTARFHFPVKDGFSPVLLDVNAYLGTFDYELEWELDLLQNKLQPKQLQQADTFLKELFQKLNISPAGGLKPKRVRFLERLFSLRSIR